MNMFMLSSYSLFNVLKRTVIFLKHQIPWYCSSTGYTQVAGPSFHHHLEEGAELKSSIGLVGALVACLAGIV